MIVPSLRSTSVHTTLVAVSDRPSTSRIANLSRTAGSRLLVVASRHPMHMGRCEVQSHRETTVTPHSAVAAYRRESRSAQEIDSRHCLLLLLPTHRLHSEPGIQLRNLAPPVVRSDRSGSVSGGFALVHLPPSPPILFRYSLAPATMHRLRARSRCLVKVLVDMARNSMAALDDDAVVSCDGPAHRCLHRHGGRASSFGGHLAPQMANLIAALEKSTWCL